MKIKFIHWIDPEDWDFTRIIRDAGYAHEVDGSEIEEKIWNGGTRELAVQLELDTETGIITVVA